MSDQENIKQKKYIYSKEKIKEYNKNYREKYKDEKQYCSLCFKYYPTLSKVYHIHSKQHQISLHILTSLLGITADLEKAEDIPSESKA